jgi:O-antigen/teichoic acid export membrane protein
VRSGRRLCRPVSVGDDEMLASNEGRAAVGGRTRPTGPVIDHLLSSRDVTDDLRGRSVRGGVVTLGGQAGRFVLQLGSTMILARLLAPEDFGLLAMVAAVTGLVAVFKDFGLASATVQREQITHRQVSNLFWINSAVSACLLLLTVAAAPLIAGFYGEPRLVGITFGMATTFLFGGLTAQHLALLRRSMRLTAIAIIEVASLGIGVVLAVTTAWLGAGYWALVLMQVGMTAAKMFMCWAVCSWRPSRPTREVDVRPLVRFGANLSGFAIVNYAARNTDEVLIGWQLGAGPVGLYSRAYTILMMPLKQIDGPLTGVAVPAMSRLQHEPEAYRRYYLRAVGVIAYLALPLVAAMAAVPTEIVLLFLGDQWIEAGEIFRWLAFAGLLQPVMYTAGWIHTSIGRTDRMFRWALISTPLYVASFAIGLIWGTTGVAMAYAVATNLLFVPTMVYAFAPTPVDIRDLLRAIARPLLLASIIYTVATLVGPALPDHWPVILFMIVALGAGTLAAAVVAALLPGCRRELGRLLVLRHELARSKSA